MKTILIADDDESTRFLVQRALEPLGHQLLTAADGEETLRLAREHRPDLVLLDIMMPHGHGYSVLQRLREDSHSASLRVVFLSSKAYPQDKRAAAELGADGFVTKPFKVDELRETAARMLDEAPGTGCD